MLYLNSSIKTKPGVNVWFMRRIIPDFLYIHMLSTETSIASKAQTDIFEGCCPYLFDGAYEQNSVERLSSRTGTCFCLTCRFTATHLSWCLAGTRPSPSCQSLGKTRGTEESTVVTPPGTKHGHRKHRGDITMTSRVDLGDKFCFCFVF